jgi:glutaredoxin
MGRTQLLLIMLVVAGIATADGQQLYKSVTSSGQVVYSDRPPPEAAARIVSIGELPASRLPEAALRAREQFVKNIGVVAPVVPMPSGGVQLYAAAWCRYCVQAKAWLGERGIAYQEVDIDTPAGQLAQARAGGGKGIPFIVANGQRVTGFSAAGYQKLFPDSRR